MSTSAEVRRQQIEAKKARLESIKQSRVDRQSSRLAELQKRETVPASSSTLSSSSRRDVDSLLASVLGPGSPGPSSSHASSFGGEPQSPSPSVPSTPARRSSLIPPQTPGRGDGDYSGDSRGSEAGTDSGFREAISPFRSAAPDLVNAQTELYALPPKQTLSYTKAVQTSFGTSTSDDGHDNPLVNDELTGGSGRETEDEMRKRIQKEFEEEKRRLDEEIERERAQLQREIEDDRARDLTEDQRTQIYSAPGFLEFVENSSKIVQRALSDGYDYIRDYTTGGENALDEDEGKSLKLVCSFSDDRWTRGRSVTDVDWSPKYPELCVASYNKNPLAVNDPDGLACVWNMHLLDRPEFIFQSQTDVLSVAFSPFNSNLVFGGTYSGQILLWDTRAKHMPVLKTPLSASGHTYPVYALRLVGTQNAHHLISSSTDGMVCSWLTDMLAQPQETLQLVRQANLKTNEVSITTLDFPANETTTFWVGTEEGNLYQANRYDRAGAKAGLNQHDVYKAHTGPVTSVSFHPGVGSIDFSDLFLTSSVDWTVRLWRSRSSSSSATGSGAGSSSGGAGGASSGLGGGAKLGAEMGGATPTVNVPPIHSFEEATDYVYDVKWHPINPALFGTADGSGKFDLWNLNEDTEVPIQSAQIPSSRAINKLSWDKKDGRRAALGSSDGIVHVYDIGDAAIPKESEWTDLQKTVAGFLGTQAVAGQGSTTSSGADAGWR